MPDSSSRARFGRASGPVNVLGVLASLVVVGFIVLLFFAWMLRDFG
ncbi:hypothetical protein [Aquihabitans sp. McL0605]